MTDPTKSGIPRCPHGCYKPGNFADACSVCNPIPVREGDGIKTLLVRDAVGWINLAKK